LKDIELKEKTLTFEDFQRFLTWLPKIQAFVSEKGRPPMSSDSFALLYKLMFYCALRPDEAINLKKSDFDVEERIVLVKTFRTKKVQKTTIPPIILGDVKKILKIFKNNDYIFVSKQDKKRITRQIPWVYSKDAGNLAGINVFKVSEKHDVKGISLSLFRESFERFFSEKKAERGLIDLKFRNKTSNKYGNYNLEDLKKFERTIFPTMLSEDEIDEYCRWYQTNLEVYEKLSKKIEEILKEITDERKINIHNITSRAKKLEEFYKKISHGVTYDAKEMQDLAGIKIICYVKSDVEKVKKIIEETFRIVKRKIPNYENFTEDLGYTHNQYICKFTNERIKFSEELRKFENRIFEIQIRTILQNAWDEIEHDDIYKNNMKIKPELKRRFFLVSKVLESTDNELDNLHSMVPKE